jgi:predicted transcriptional regulator
MGLIWKLGSATVNELETRVNAKRTASLALAYTTILTVCSRLEAKGLLVHEAAGRANRYRPALSETDFIATKADEAARRLLEQFGSAALPALVDRVNEDNQLLEQLGALLGEDRHEEGRT